MHGDEGAVGERRDGLGRGEAGLGCRELIAFQRNGAGFGIRHGQRAQRRVHQLDGARLVAQHDELHLLLVAHGIDPSGNRNGAVGQGGKVLDQYTRSHDVNPTFAPRPA